MAGISTWHDFTLSEARAIQGCLEREIERIERVPIQGDPLEEDYRSALVKLRLRFRLDEGSPPGSGRPEGAGGNRLGVWGSDDDDQQYRS
jgi:hypothetical protein